MSQQPQNNHNNQNGSDDSAWAVSFCAAKCWQRTNKNNDEYNNQDST